MRKWGKFSVSLGIEPATKCPNCSTRLLTVDGRADKTFSTSGSMGTASLLASTAEPLEKWSAAAPAGPDGRLALTALLLEAIVERRAITISLLRKMAPCCQSVNFVRLVKSVDALLAGRSRDVPAITAHHSCSQLLRRTAFAQGFCHFDLQRLPLGADNLLRQTSTTQSSRNARLVNPGPAALHTMRVPPGRVMSMVP